MKKTVFTQEHEWLRIEDDGIVTVGITDYAQDHLGDLVYCNCRKPARKSPRARKPR